MISQADKEQFRLHARNCADAEGYRANPYEKDPDVILRFWKENKQKYLYKLLGNEIILTKKVTYNKDSQELYTEMDRMVSRNYSFVRQLLDRLDQATKPNWAGTFGSPSNNAARFYVAVRDMLNASNLVEGRVPLNLNSIVMGKEIQLTCGQKSMRAIGRIATLLDLQQEFEDFRIAHSQVLNQRTISGDLHLSIHPLDYATASDNANGWSSCMSWDEQGCYRLGTVEMMNSPMVICAYLTGHNIMPDVGGKEWNSKKWRAWAIVNEDVILVNRQYPYDNSDIAKIVIDWIKQLAKNNLGWEYQETQIEFDYCDYGMSFLTNYMYNDTTNGMPGAPAIHMEKFGSVHHSYNFSGPAVCMWCGEEIPYEGNSEAANTLCCNKCREGYVCSCCGTELTEDEVNWGPDDNVYCCDCYNENFIECDHCGDIMRSEDTIHLEMGVNHELLNKLIEAEGNKSNAYKKYKIYWFGFANDNFSFPDCFHAAVCDYCLNDMSIKATTDILIDVPMPYEFYANSWNNSYRHVNTIDPTKVTFDQAKKVFNFFRDYEDSDGSLTRVWKAMWADHISKLINEGLIKV